MFAFGGHEVLGGYLRVIYVAEHLLYYDLFKQTQMVASRFSLRAGDKQFKTSLTLA